MLASESSEECEGYEGYEGYGGYDLGSVTARISFCDSACINITSNVLKKHIFRTLEKYNINPIQNNFVKLDSNKLKNVLMHPHLLSTVSHGSSYLVYLTIIGGTQVAVFIDRKLKENHTYPKMHILHYNFAAEVYNETILTGELIRDSNQRWFMLLDNVLLYKGIQQHGVSAAAGINISERLRILHYILSVEYHVNSENDICPFQIKRMFYYNEFEQLMEMIRTQVTYAVKGIAFYTLNVKCTNYIYEFPRDSNHLMQVSTATSECSAGRLIAVGAYVQKQMPMPMHQRTLVSRVSAHKDEHRDEHRDEYMDEYRDAHRELRIFKVLRTDKPDIYQLYHYEKRQLCLNSIALVPTLKISMLLNSVFESANTTELDMNCCASKVYENRWIPVSLSNVK